MKEVHLPHNAEYLDQEGNLAIDVSGLFAEQRRRSMGGIWNPASIKPVFEAIYYEVKWLDNGKEMSAIKSLTFDPNGSVGDQGVVDVMLTSNLDPHVEHTQYRLFKSSLDEKKKLTKSQPDPNDPGAPWITRFGVIGSNQYIATNEARELQEEFNTRKESAFRLDGDLKLSGVPGTDHVSEQPIVSFWHEEEIYSGDITPAPATVPAQPQVNVVNQPTPTQANGEVGAQDRNLTSEEWERAWNELTNDIESAPQEAEVDLVPDSDSEEVVEGPQSLQRQHEVILNEAEKGEFDKAMWDVEFDLLNSGSSGSSGASAPSGRTAILPRYIPIGNSPEPLSNGTNGNGSSVKNGSTEKKRGKKSRGVKAKEVDRAINPTPELPNAPEGFRYLHMKNGQIRRQRISDGKFVGSDWLTSKERDSANGTVVLKNVSNGNGQNGYDQVIVLPNTQLPEGVEIELGVGVKVRLSSPVAVGDKVH